MQIETESWQALVQYLASVFGRGYYYYQVVPYPKKKRDEWSSLDQKMIERFNMLDSKYKRARRKKDKGWSNVLLIRYQERLYILMTDGDTPPHVDLTGERFLDIRKQALQIQLGNVMRLVISHSGKKVNIHMPRDYFKERKSFIEDLAKSKALKKIKNDLAMLKGIPGYRGINQQRKELIDVAVKSLRKNQCQVSRAYFEQFHTRADTRQVFKRDNDD